MVQFVTYFTAVGFGLSMPVFLIGQGPRALTEGVDAFLQRK